MDQLICKYEWITGSSHPRNQDTLLCMEAVLQGMWGNRHFLLAAVSDGIGGLSRGENASGILGSNLREWYYLSLNEYRTGILAGCHGRWKKKRFHTMFRTLWEASRLMRREREALGGQEGATLAAVVLIGSCGWVFWVGDSLVYLRGGKGRRYLTDPPAKTSCLEACIGSMGAGQVKYRRFRFSPGMELTVCSDGYLRKDGTDDASCIRILTERKEKRE